MLQLNKPVPDVFTESLHLRRIRPDLTMACWIEFGHAHTRVCRAVIEGRGVQPLPAPVLPATHLAGFPTADEHHVYWLELTPTASSIRRLAHDVDDPAAAECVYTAPARCLGQFSLTRGHDGECLVLAERFHEHTVGLQLIRASDGQQLRDIHSDDMDYRRPVCATTPGGTPVAAWDSYDRRHARHTCQFLQHPEADVITVPPDAPAYDKLPAVLCTADGRILVALCRETPVWLGSAVTWHTELVVWSFQTGTFSPVTSVPIDFAMNPWLAPYWGKRRFPMLRGDRNDNAFLLWEERIEPESFPPSYGRLCALSLASDADGTEPFVLSSGQSVYSVEDAPAAARLWIGSKTQHEPYDFELPWQCEAADLDANHVRRSPVADNSAYVRTEPRTPLHERPRMADTGFSLFWGDPHIHSRRSKDLDGEPDELLHFARDFAALDFAALTENDCTRFSDPLSGFEWECICRDAELFNQAGAFSCFPGWEYTEHRNKDWPGSTDAHRSVLFACDGGTMFSCQLQENRPVARLAANYARCGEEPLIHLHAPYGDYTPHALEANIEICSGWSNRMRDPGLQAFVHRILLEGARLGFIGCSDNHERNPGMGGGLTGVWAVENTRAALSEALRARRVYATTGVRVDLRFRVNGTFMGGITEISGAPDIRVDVRAPCRVERIDIIRDGAVVHTAHFDDSQATLKWTDTGFHAGVKFYPHVTLATQHPDLPWEQPVVLPFNLAPVAGRDAWASPVFIQQAKDT